MTAPLRLLLLTTLVGPSLGCSDDAPAAKTGRARPVSLQTLRRQAPPEHGLITGVVEPHREEQIGFEVTGRIESSTILGKEVRGPELGDDGDPVPGREGEVIATIDETRYRQALQAAELRQRAAEAAEAVRRIEAEELRPTDVQKAMALEGASRQELNAAEAALENATQDFDRAERLVGDGTISRSEYDRAKSTFDNATATAEAARETIAGRVAEVKSAQANLGLAQSRLEQARAEVAEAKQKVEQAQTDLDDCLLRAPFNGRITEVFAGRGTYVQPGEAVVTMTLMDPIKVVITVSAEQNRLIKHGAGALLRPRDLARYSEQPLVGMVLGKSDLADPATRTFKIELMVRNVREGSGADDVSLAERVMPVLRKKAFSDGPLFVWSECVEREGGGTFVYRVPGARFGVATGGFQDSYVPERIAVELLDERMTLLSFPMIRVADGSSLQEGDILIANPTAETLDGVTLDRSDWALLPGELVPVQLDLGRRAAGFWVPVRALQNLNDRTSLFIVDGDVAREIEVTMAESAGDQRRVEGEGLADGVRYVVDGGHYLADGDRVDVVSTDA